MKKNILFLTLALLVVTSCSKTWSGIQQDTREVVENTKEVIHEATAPDPIIEDVPDVKPLPKVTPVETVKQEAILTKPVVAVEPVI